MGRDLDRLKRALLASGTARRNCMKAYFGVSARNEEVGIGCTVRHGRARRSARFERDYCLDSAPATVADPVRRAEFELEG
jgi:hypothetical protein